jgi:hypothetical protein
LCVQCADFVILAVLVILFSIKNLQPKLTYDGKDELS